MLVTAARATARAAVLDGFCWGSLNGSRNHFYELEKVCVCVKRGGRGENFEDLK